MMVKGKPRGRKGGRKKVNIDWDMLDKYLVSGANGPQVAAVAGVHRDTLYARCLTDNGIDFTSYSQERRQKGNSNLLGKQYQVAMGGNTTMLIWLGKQRLGQSEQPKDKQEFNGSLAGLLDVMHLINNADDFTALVDLARKSREKERSNVKEER